MPRVFAAADAGQIINPDGLANQIEGGIIQSTSWTLHEQVRFDRDGITSRDWQRLSDPHHAGSPAGRGRADRSARRRNRSAPAKASQGPAVAAIANAFAAATGKRIRELPLTPDRVKAALGRTNVLCAENNIFGQGLHERRQRMLFTHAHPLFWAAIYLIGIGPPEAIATPSLP